MSKDDEKMAAKNDDNLLSTIIPVLVAAIVSFGCSAAYDKLFRDAAVTEQVSSPTLVLSIGDWTKEIAVGESPEKIERVFFEARRAAQAAARAGFVVVDEDKVIASPKSARLLPGMFDVAGE